MNTRPSFKWLRGRCLALLLVAIVLLSLAIPALAQNGDPPEAGGAVQELMGSAASGAFVAYALHGLQEGQDLYIYVTGTSGNLDPMAGLASLPFTSDSLEFTFNEAVQAIIAQDLDPLTAQEELFGDTFVTWDDDSGAGYDVALHYTVPSSSTYHLLVARNPFSDTFGDYRMLIGVDAPEVLTGQAEPTGDIIAQVDPASSRFEAAVQEFEGEISGTNLLVVKNLRRLRQGDTLNAYVTATSGDLRPLLVLNDFGGKPLRSANLSGSEPWASLQYVLEEDADDLQIEVSSAYVDGSFTEGEYRLVLGVNATQVLEERVEPEGRAIVPDATPVEIGVKLQQITGVDQISEKFGGVAELTLKWWDPGLAFSPDSCDCSYLIFTGDQFTKYAVDLGVDWPQFTIYNQQGNRWVQNRNTVVRPDGSTTYQERFTTDFQAPLFDFRRFPFDNQELYIRVDSLYPESFFSFLDVGDLSLVGDELGEEEWYIREWDTEIETIDGVPTYWLRFVVGRQLNFYVFRILLPIILIIIVSWFVFFLRDYGKRVDVASANLLVFVAFNFTVSGELPRLGYLTFMDAVLIGVFIISAVVVVVNVGLKRLEGSGRHELAAKIDRPLIWLYPILYVVGAFVAYWLFLR